jgi:transcription initiation factor IIF auxiliary subunit
LSQAEQLQALTINPNPNSSLLPDPKYLSKSQSQRERLPNVHMMNEISGDRENLTPTSSREGSIEVTGDSIDVRRLKKLNAIRKADDNNLKIATGLKNLQSQQVMSLNDQSLLD